MYATGIPKSGTRALLKSLQLLNAPVNDVEHNLYSKKQEGKYICITRNPRNILISWLRMNDREISLQNIINVLYYPMLGATFLKWHLSLKQWKNDPNTMIVQYEDLIESPNTMIEIANYMDIPYVQGAWNNLPGGTFTYNEVPSRWQDYWNDEVQEAWEAGGGLTMEQIWQQ